MARGRPSKGTSHVDRLEGGNETKARLKVILETVAGRLSVEEACKRLGVSRSRFNALRTQALQGALDQLEPRVAGRPPAQMASPEQQRIDALEKEKKWLELEVLAAQTRTEIALAMPQVIRDASGKPRCKKGGARGPKKKTRSDPRTSRR